MIDIIDWNDLEKSERYNNNSNFSRPLCNNNNNVNYNRQLNPEKYKNFNSGLFQNRSKPYENRF